MQSVRKLRDITADYEIREAMIDYLENKAWRELPYSVAFCELQDDMFYADDVELGSTVFRNFFDNYARRIICDN